MGFLDGRRNVKVQMDDGSHKVASMVEGAGVYVCHVHKFATEDKEKFDIHMKTEAGHTLVNSQGICVICNSEVVNTTGYPAGENPVCPKCEERLVKSRQRVHARMDETKKKEEKK
jgi:hypothetical protein